MLRAVIRGRLRVLAGAAAALATLPAAARADMPRELERDGVRDIVVERRAGMDREERAALRADAGVRLAETLRLPRTEVVRAAPGGLTEALAALRADPDVVLAEPDAPVRASSADAFFSHLWGLRNTGQDVDDLGSGFPDADIDAPIAWAGGALGAGQVVAVADTGITASIPDLAGRIDTAHAHDWVDGDDNPADLNGHGTHVSGTIVAKQDTTGITGVAPSAKVLPLRVLDADGEGTWSDIAQAFDLAGDLGVRVVNASLGGTSPSSVAAQVIADHPSTLYVVAAGNDGVDNDRRPHYPCAMPAANLICVGATDPHDVRAGFSNTGATTVDLFAPGVSILSTVPGPSWGWANGTSMATPHVAGALALMTGVAPALTAAQLKQALLSGVEVRSQLSGLSVTGGRLNAAAAVDAARQAAGIAVPARDTDGDGVTDTADVCAEDADPGQADGDGDGIGDACDPTPGGPDGDVDGVVDAADRCPAAYDPAQRDSDGDGLGDACDPTPAGPARTTPPAPAPPAPAPTPPSRVAPVLTIDPGPANPAVVVCDGRRRCRPRPLTLVLRLSVAARVTAEIERRACHGSRCRWVPAADVVRDARAGTSRVVIGTGATARLHAGSYRVSVSARAGRRTSATTTRAFRVRAR